MAVTGRLACILVGGCYSFAILRRWIKQIVNFLCRRSDQSNDLTPGVWCRRLFIAHTTICRFSGGFIGWLILGENNGENAYQ